jgi:hypothetical protein
MREALSTRRFAVAAVITTLLVAGAVSLVASSAPDGLQRVATDTGFATSGAPSATSGSPLAGYHAVVHGPLGRSLAGVLGVLIVLGLVYGLTRLLRRRATEH